MTERHDPPVAVPGPASAARAPCPQTSQQRQEIADIASRNPQPGPASVSPAEPSEEHPDATSRPWAIDPAEPCQFGGDLQGSEGEWGAYVGETTEPEDAALIVQAVNERAALLAVGERDKAEIERLTEFVQGVAEFRCRFERDDGSCGNRALGKDCLYCRARAALAEEDT